MGSNDIKPATGSGQTQTLEEDTKPLYGGAAEYLYRAKGLTWDVVKEYPWTLSKNKDLLDEAPFITLYEYEIDESTIKQQISYYTTAVATAVASNSNPLAPYENLFPRSKDPINIYNFPYFSDINFKLSTPQWQSLDTLEQGQKFAEGIGGIIAGEKGAQFVSSVIEGGAATVGAALAVQYPKIGIMDRPKLWQSHEFRTIEIKFHLFNTLGPNDWEKNYNLCWHLVNQNLFTKRDFITGIPPVYYEFIIPGQYYSFAASVTDIMVYNRGNMRRIKNSIVPDVYEINITLQDMVMPSRNLFQALRYKQNQITVNRVANEPGTPITEPYIAKAVNAGLETTGKAITRSGAKIVDTAINVTNRVGEVASNTFNRLTNQ